MRGRIRWCHWGKWTGAALAGLVAVLWFVTGWYRIAAVYVNEPSRYDLFIHYGELAVVALTLPPLPPAAAAGAPTPRQRAFAFQGISRLSTSWRPDWSSLPVFRRRPGGMVMASLPLWLLFFAIAGPAAWLWRRDRRQFTALRCPGCGYDLAGVSGGVCPECGAGLVAGV